MSTLRVTNIEAKKDPSSPLVDEKVKLTNSDGDVVLEVDGKNVGAGQTVFISSGIVTATTVNVGTAVTISAGIITANNFVGSDGTFDILNGGANIALHVDGGAPASSLHVRNDGVVEAGSSLVVGNSFIQSEAVGLGTTNTTGRDAGVGTATGTLIYIPDTGLQVYTGNEVGWRTVDSTEDTALETTGGTKTTVGSRTYHTFANTGSLVVSGVVGSKTANFLVVAGGGGGGDWSVGGAGANGGGGAGGVVSGDALPLQNGTYTVTIGAGGASTGQNPSTPGPSKSGANSTIAAPFLPSTVTANGGGGGGNDGNDSVAPGGSGGGSHGGGGAPAPAPNRAATQPGTNSDYNATDLGNPGGTGISGSGNLAGGGGGAGAAGGNGTPTFSGAGGIGQPFGLDFTPSANGTSGPNPGQYFGGGGGGSTHGTPGTQNDGGAGGGAGGIDPGAAANANGTANTGGGGGGGNSQGPGGHTQNGGSGIVVISYI